jgi:hypothetical protein
MPTTAAIAGQYCVLRVSAAGVTYTTVGEVIGANITRNRTSIPANSNLDVQNEQKIPGRSNNQASFETNWVVDDAGQVIVRAGFAASTQLYWKFMPIGTLGKGIFTFVGAILTMEGPTMGDNQVDVVRCTIDVTGAVTEGVVVAGDLA